jgi:DNA invertase Pin-like site-specific DNA recombinase
VIECLHSQCKGLSSNLSTAKRERDRERERRGRLKNRKEGKEMMETEIGVIQPQAKDYSSHQRLKEAGKGFSSELPEGM